MKLTYETGIASFIQFIVVSLFILVTQLGSSVTSCFKSGSDCVNNLITSIIFFLLAAVVFGGIWLVGYVAQIRRSRRLALLLICIEGPIAMVALFSVKLNLHSRNYLGLIASVGMLVLTGLIIFLAFRLVRSKGGRVVVRQRRRRRPSTL